MSDEPVSLEFPAREQQRMLEEMRGGLRSVREEMHSMRDDMQVPTAMVMRLDGTAGRIRSEIRAMHGQHQHLANRVRRIEERLETPEP